MHTILINWPCFCKPCLKLSSMRCWRARACAKSSARREEGARTSPMIATATCRARFDTHFCLRFAGARRGELFGRCQTPPGFAGFRKSRLRALQRTIPGFALSRAISWILLVSDALCLALSSGDSSHCSISTRDQHTYGQNEARFTCQHIE